MRQFERPRLRQTPPLPDLTLVLTKVLHDEGPDVGDGEQPLAGCVDANRPRSRQSIVAELLGDDGCVPVPQKQSSTRSSGFDEVWMMRSRSGSGFWVRYPVSGLAAWELSGFDVQSRQSPSGAPCDLIQVAHLSVGSIQARLDDLARSNLLLHILPAIPPELCHRRGIS